jgi:thiol-disulfide isomerase/thioredoxin
MMRGALAAVVVTLAGATAAAKPSPLAALQGDVTVVAFFSTACAPCKKELPMVEALRAQVAGDARVRVVAVSVDDTSEAARARAMAKQLGLTMPVLVDARVYFSLFGGSDLAVPRLAVIDRKRAGLQRMGARAGEARDAFVREVIAAISSVAAGGAAPPTPMWQPLPSR